MRIPDEEITFRASRAGGPGGQHVNRRATRVEARWNVIESPSLSDAQRTRLLDKLSSRIGKDGVLRVVADEERSQARNREIAARRLRDLVNRALRRPKPRKKTRPPGWVKEARLREKRRRGERKAKRKPPQVEE